MKKIYWIVLSCLALGLTSCVDLDIAPKNILQDEDIYNEAAIQAYMAGMYSMLPMDDFKVTTNGTNLGRADGYFGWDCRVWTHVSTGEAHTRDNTGMVYHYPGYWTEAYKIIRSANQLIDNLPAYETQFVQAKQWIAESKFIRAYVYFQLVKRYGGMPIVDHVQQYDPDFSTLQVPRSSNKDCYDFILQDLSDAIAGMPEASQRGRANKYVAAGLKSKVALFAATIAKYGAQWVYMSKKDPNLMLCGIPAQYANDYFKQAWDAAKVVGDAGKYELYGASASTYDAKVAANTGWYTDAVNSKESMLIREYDYNNYVHSWDAVHLPQRLRADYGNRLGITLDIVELFDGKNPTTGREFVDPATGRINVLDYEGATAYYHVFDTPSQLYDGVEPRLRSLIFIPNDSYKGEIRFDMRGGIVPESVDPATAKLKKEYPDDYKTTTAYSAANWPSLFPQLLRTTADPRAQTNPVVVTTNGVQYSLYRNGIDGPVPSGGNVGYASSSGFHGRKWMNFNMVTSSIKLHTSTQPWVDMRYAEILLNRAEAALELFQAGVSHGGVDLQQDAFTCINAVRGRAGADLLAGQADLSTAAAYDRLDNPGKGGFVQAPNRGLQIVRVERYKELALEHKIYWDLRRWFTFDTQIKDYRKRGLVPFMFAKGATAAMDPYGSLIPQGKYIYDPRAAENGAGAISFSPAQNYYENIPGGEMRKSELLEGNRNQ